MKSPRACRVHVDSINKGYQTHTVAALLALLGSQKQTHARTSGLSCLLSMSRLSLG